jgi:hypothetical protein
LAFSSSRSSVIVLMAAGYVNGALAGQAGERRTSVTPGGR